MPGPGSLDHGGLRVGIACYRQCAAVTRLLDEIGYDTVDLGPLAEGWRTQRDIAAYGVMYAADPADWWSKEPGAADVEKVAAAAASVKRYRDM